MRAASRRGTATGSSPPYPKQKKKKKRKNRRKRTLSSSFFSPLLRKRRGRQNAHLPLYSFTSLIRKEKKDFRRKRKKEKNEVAGGDRAFPLFLLFPEKKKEATKN